MLLDLDRDLLLFLVTDLAQGFLDTDEIAEKYGFRDEGELYEYLAANAPVRRLYQRHKAIYDSDEAVDKRIRLKAGIAVEELIPHIAQLVAQPHTPNGQKLDGFHKLLRAAGTDGAPPVPLRGAEGGGGPLLNLSIVFSDREVKITEHLPTAPPMIEHEEK